MAGTAEFGCVRAQYIMEYARGLVPGIMEYGRGLAAGIMEYARWRSTIAMLDGGRLDATGSVPAWVRSALVGTTLACRQPRFCSRIVAC